MRKLVALASGIALSATFALGAILASPSISAAEDSEGVDVFKDDQLRQCVAGIMYRMGFDIDFDEELVITAQDLAAFVAETDSEYVIWCDGDYNSYTSLDGLEYLIGSNLTDLTVFGGSISDLTPLQNLYSLRLLALPYHQIEDIGPLSSLTNLTWLYLENNHIVDLSPLSGITGLDLYATGQTATATGAAQCTVPLDYVTTVDGTPAVWEIESGNATLNTDGTITYGAPGKVVLEWYATELYECQEWDVYWNNFGCETEGTWVEAIYFSGTLTVTTSTDTECPPPPCADCGDGDGGAGGGGAGDGGNGGDGAGNGGGGGAGDGGSKPPVKNPPAGGADKPTSGKDPLAPTGGTSVPTSHGMALTIALMLATSAAISLSLVRKTN